MSYYDFVAFELDEERDLKNYEAWVCDAKDCIPILTPLELWSGVHGGSLATQHGAETISIPMGVLDVRTKYGCLYFSRINLSNEERRRREPIFRERITPWIDDFEQVWRGKFVPELTEGFERLKNVDVENLDNIELRVYFDQCIAYLIRNWEIHHICHYASFTLYGLFEDMCKELLGTDENHPKFKAVMSGFDNRIFQVHGALWQLGEEATKLGLAPIFQSSEDNEKLLSDLEQTENGKKWLHALRQLLQEDGWRTEGTFGLANPSWIEKPSQALPSVKTAIAKGGAFFLNQERERLARERQEVENEIHSRLPIDKREWFDKLLKAAQWVGRYSEEHVFYCEHFCNSLVRRVTMEIGSRFARDGVIDVPEDIYFLIPQEIKGRIIPSWRCDAHKLVQIRKEQRQEFQKMEVPIFIGDVSKIGDIISDEVILLRSVAGVPIVKPELKADLYGSNSSPGVVEGVARVIFSEAEFSLVQPEEILVAVTTGPVWTPLFGIAKGVVTDTGGGLTHAVIIGREYGLPAVVGTMEGTRKIKTGQRIRVDGDNCCVYLLD